MASIYDVVLEKIKHGEFENKNPYPDESTLFNHPAYQELVSKAEELKKKSNKLQGAMKDLRDNLRRKYQEDKSEAIRRFKATLEKEYGLTNHPKREKLWDKAYDDGHSEGFTGILNVYDELVDLIL